MQQSFEASLKVCSNATSTAAQLLELPTWHEAAAAEWLHAPAAGPLGTAPNALAHRLASPCMASTALSKLNLIIAVFSAQR